MSYYSSGKLDYKSHGGFDWTYCVRMCGRQTIESNKGVAIIKYTPSYASQTQIEHGFCAYWIVSTDGTHFTRHTQDTIDADVNGYVQAHSRLDIANIQHEYPTYVDPSESDYVSEAGILHPMYKTAPPGPYPGVDYWDGDLYDSANLPIFNFNGSDGINAFNNYLDTGDDSGAENYEDLHPMQYNTTVWMDGKYPNLYWKTEVGEEATPVTTELTCEIYATPLIQAVKTFNNQYSLNSMQYVQYSDYADPTKIPSIGGGTQPTPYVFYVNPLDNTDTDYDAQITFYVNDDGTVSNISIQGSAKHTITISDEPTPSDSDYPDEQTNFNHDKTTSFQDGTSVNTLTTTYRISASQLRALGNFLWSNTFKDGILGLVNYPLENIVSLKCMPVNLGGTDTVIKIGNVDTGIHGDKCDYRVSGYQAYVGSCTIKRPFNNFMDYTDIELSIYLPFIGYKPLDAVMVMGRKIELTYIYDCVLGNCMAVLEVYDDSGNRIMFDCHQGTCGIDIAITSTNRADIENGMINSVLSGIGHLASAVSGNVVGGVLGVAGDVFKGSTQGFHTQSTGVGNPSLMTKMDTTAFVILKRPQIMDVDKQHYGHHYGYPCNLYKKLKELSGFTQTKDFVCSLINNATDEEKAEIESLLNSGIYIM